MSRRPRRFFAVLTFALALAPLGCRRPKPVQIQQTEEEVPRLTSMIQMGDPKSEAQLVTGFYGIEQNVWRWTGQHFSAVLRPPFGAAQKGATLQLAFTVPPVIIANLKTISLSASVGSTSLSPETYTQPGEYVYKRDLAPALLNSDAVRVDFSLDKSMPPSGADQRELGVVATRLWLDPK